jgi:formate/nitrite transporter
MGGAVFPIALFLIIITGGELFTGNLMLLSVALMSGKTTWYALFRNWFIVYLGNFTGCVIMGYFGTYLASMIDADPYQAYLQNVVKTKMSLGWGSVFLRGIGANWLVCLAVFLGVASESFEGKIIGMWWPIAAFATIGYEHCIANMYFIMTGLMYSSPYTFGEFLARNLIPATLGNMVAAIIFMACVYYYVYRDFAMPALSAMRLRQAVHRHLPHGLPHFHSLPSHHTHTAHPTLHKRHGPSAKEAKEAAHGDTLDLNGHAPHEIGHASAMDHAFVKIHEANV